MIRLSCLLLTVLIVQTVVAQTASAPIRVQVTGVARYDIPGVITIEENRISGRRPVTRSPSMIRFSRTDSEPAVSILLPGRRVTGEARRVEGGLLEFIGDDDNDVSFILTDSIFMVEREKAAIASRETARSIGLGTGAAIFGLSYLGALSCQPDEHVEGLCWRFFQTLMFVGAPVVGVCWDGPWVG